MSNIERVTPSIVAAGGRIDQLRTRQTSRALAAIEHHTIVRLAGVQGEAMVQAEKLHEVDRLAQVAMSGQALLTKWQQTLAGGDPLLHDDLKFFTDVAKLSKGEILADTIASFRHR